MESWGTEMGRFDLILGGPTVERICLMRTFCLGLGSSAISHGVFGIWLSDVGRVSFEFWGPDVGRICFGLWHPYIHRDS